MKVSMIVFSDLIDARFATYVGVSALLIMTPGPDMALVTRNALSTGRRGVATTAAGVAVGILGWAIASTIGVGLVLEQSVLAFTALKVAGAVYLGFLGIRSLLDSVHHGRPETVERRTSSPLGSMTAFRQGVLGNLLNPKAGVIFVSILPQFVRPGDSPLRLLLMLLAFEFLLLIWLNIFGYAITRARASQVGDTVSRWLERVTGVILIGLGLRLVVERR